MNRETSKSPLCIWSVCNLLPFNWNFHITTWKPPVLWTMSNEASVPVFCPLYSPFHCNNFLPLGAFSQPRDTTLVARLDLPICTLGTICLNCLDCLAPVKQFNSLILLFCSIEILTSRSLFHQWQICTKWKIILVHLLVLVEIYLGFKVVKWKY